MATHGPDLIASILEDATKELHEVEESALDRLCVASLLPRGRAAAAWDPRARAQRDRDRDRAKRRAPSREEREPLAVLAAADALLDARGETTDATLLAPFGVSDPSESGCEE